MQRIFLISRTYCELVIFWNITLWLAQGMNHQGIFPKSYDLAPVIKSESLRSARNPACQHFVSASLEHGDIHCLGGTAGQMSGADPRAQGTLNHQVCCWWEGLQELVLLSVKSQWTFPHSQKGNQKNQFNRDENYKVSWGGFRWWIRSLKF